MGNEDIRWQQRFQNFEKSLDHLRFSEPDSTEVLGKVKIGDSGFTTNCSYEAVINKAKMGSRKVGGNAIKIIEHNPPTALGSSCHRITAKILRIEDIENYILKVEEEVLLDVGYAILNVYRYGVTGALIAYDLNLGAIG